MSLMSQTHWRGLSMSWTRMILLRKESSQKPMLSRSQDRPCTRRPAGTLARIELKISAWERKRVPWELSTVVGESYDIAAFPVVEVQNDNW